MSFISIMSSIYAQWLPLIYDMSMFWTKLNAYWCLEYAFLIYSTSISLIVCEIAAENWL